MSYKTILDNIYPVGTFITAKKNPSIKLEISNYYRRIYYCAAVEENGPKKQLAYFERELISPEKPGEQLPVLTPKQHTLWRSSSGILYMK